MYHKIFNSKNAQQIIVGFVAGVWITLFLTFVGPFDAAELSFEWRLQVMYGYGIVFFLSYIFMIPISYLLNSFFNLNLIFREVLFYLLLLSISLVGSFAYYNSETINGDYYFSRFTLEIFFPTIIIFMPFILIVKWAVSKLNVALKAATIKQHKKTDDQLEMWKSKIDSLMNEKVYLNSNLNLKDLANQLETNSSVLSRVINQGYKSNFNDFVNGYRIEAVKKAIQNGDHHKHNLNGIALNCGFNSKATFNRVFKSMTQVSPSEYVKNIES